MHILASLAAVSLATVPAASSLLPPPLPIFSNTNDEASANYRIPTVHESAVMARRILHLTPIGTLATIFPSNSSSSSSSNDEDDNYQAAENRPHDVGNTPIGLPDYIADCEHSTGNPTLLAITIATTFKNAAAGSNVSLSLAWTPPDAHKRSYSPASLPRFSLQGYFEDYTPAEVVQHAVPACFAKAHPDSVSWYPGNPIHTSKWSRLVVTEVYWIGGFGDRAYIGWIPVEEWRNVTRAEVRDCVLPGEENRRSSWRDWLGLGPNEEDLEL
ncbi:pyridoxamine 5'-phosphate oxidase-domain-containing protein [Phyllosticta citriasiana]|uniref:Pyridoxamine 5'-phosphate oxidase-domain-containing protein n=1 Tax=Phyllosticta citriasiana TaxID=595635 RepID=A0ABR1KKH3_9PEZI